jgi:predicted MFS family arabinose efflux permease
MILAFVLALLTQFKIVTVNFILLIAVLNGIIFSLDAPARQAIVVELVGKEKILNAIALNSIGFHSARMIGPALAGIFIASISVAGCFYVNAVSFLAFIVALLLIKPQHIKKSNNNHFWQDLKGGIKFIKDNRLYFNLITTVGIMTMLGFSYVVLMPVVAKEVLNLGAKGFGLLMSASGIGSLLGGLRLANLKQPNKQLRILIFSLFTFSLSLILFALSRSFMISVLVLVLTGFSSLSSLAIVNSLIQTMVPDEFRGRIMSIYILTFAGTIPFGSIISGSLSQLLGVSNALLMIGVVCLSLSLLFSKKILVKSFIML